ncbi:Gfo/Idh/MocA family oxidoreductase [Agriterribacter sp.]|uniref:Gfo/Idh/MocA family protein n=1 Tax=Agriterribacter sp. TaxID=2821509 RepID=UPI002C0339FF|nr:Gfo/Idh/MocA family oxidoreductase [Agriterribacter sp.]HRO44971.1 Gfo/Idh/MocA family oxidoreductase [Agriterribacter sp.]HRQ15709.1 Gfo/Idh/MocA family oxidoreductase [Agriterribacter sp.]
MSSRRNFLQKLSIGLSAAALTPLSSPASVFPDLRKPVKQLRVALMGLGGYAGIVARAMKECKLATLTGIVTGTPSKIATWKSNYGIPDKNVYNYDTLHTIANNPEIDLVYVTTPNSLHHKHVLQVAAAGKHVICEKPVADNAQQAREMIAACKKAGVKFYVGYRLHFEPHTRELVRMRKAGEFGNIMHVNNYMGFKIGDPTQWRLKKALAGGGAMMDVGVYALNGARYATGEEPVWVTAQESKTDMVKFAEVDETVTFQLGFPSGVIASCGTTYNFNNYERVYLIGDKGFAELSPAFGYGPIQGRTHLGPMNQPLITHQAAQMDGLADCILNGTPDPGMTGEEGLKDMVVVDAIYESLRKGGEKIYLYKK